MGREPVIIRLAEPADRLSIYRLRHEVFAAELGQHPTNPEGLLSDDLDLVNQYLLAERASQLLGFVSVTPPEAGRYSFQKYFDEGTALPFEIDNALFEVRLLALSRTARVDGLVYLLFYAAFRWCDAHRGQSMVALAYDRVLPLYRSVGMAVHPYTVQSGQLRLHLVSAELEHMRSLVAAYSANLRGLMAAIPCDWRLKIPFVPVGQ